MNLYHLKTFYYIVKYKSFTKAADQLCVTQPAVTRLIQELQSTYDLVLFSRAGKKIVLTDAGESLFSLAEKIFELEVQVEESIRDFQHQKSGRLNIITAETFGGFYLPCIVSRFKEKHPEIYISVLTLTDRYVMERVSELKCDIGFMTKKINHPKVEARELFEESLVLITSTSHPLTKNKTIHPAELENVNFIMHEPDSGTAVIINDFLSNYSINVNVVCDFSNNDSIKALVKEGLGVAFVSKKVADNDIKRGDLAAVKVEAENLKRKYFIAYHREKYFTRLMSDFVDITYKWAEEYLHEK